MNFSQALAALATLPLLVGPTALANPPCRVCVPVKRVVKKAVVVKKVVEKVIVQKEVAAIVTVFEPVYLSQVVPAPNISYTINTPPPPAAPLQQQVHTYVAPPSIATSIYQRQVQVQAVQGQQYAQPHQHVHPQCPPPAQGQYAQPAQQQQGQPQQQQQQPQDRLDRIEAALARLCEALDKGNGNGNGNVTPPPPALPRVPGGLPTSAGQCAQCHSAQVAEKEGSGFVLFDKGSLVPLSERDMRKLYQHIAAGTMPPKEAVAAGKARALTTADQQEWFQFLGRQQ